MFMEKFFFFHEISYQGQIGATFQHQECKHLAPLGKSMSFVALQVGHQPRESVRGKIPNDTLNPTSILNKMQKSVQPFYCIRITQITSLKLVVFNNNGGVFERE